MSIDPNRLHPLDVGLVAPLEVLLTTTDRPLLHTYQAFLFRRTKIVIRPRVAYLVSRCAESMGSTPFTPDSPGWFRHLSLPMVTSTHTQCTGFPLSDAKVPSRGFDDALFMAGTA